MQNDSTEFKFLAEHADEEEGDIRVMDIPGVGGGTANMKKASNSDLFNDGETVGSSRRHMKQHSSNSSLMELVENMHRSTISVHSDSSSSSTSKRKVSKNLLSMPNNLSGAHGGNNSIGSTAGGLAPSVSQEFDQGRRSSTILYEMIAKREPPNPSLGTLGTIGSQMEMGNPGIDSSNAILPTPMRGTGTGILGTSPPKDSPSMFSPGMLGQSFTIKGGTKFSNLRDLLKQNRIWAKTMKDKDPLYFDRLRSQQNPQLLWIGCADSRVPANQIVSLAPGEVFVHRNIANVVHHVDINCLSVIQYAVEVLKVKHIIVVGHYGCGGVLTSMRTRQMGGVIDVWIRALKDIYENHREVLEALPDDDARADLLCELNVANSVLNVCKTTIVQNAWSHNQELSIHGWCYRLTDGLLRDLNICIQNADQIDKIYGISEKTQSEQ